MPAAIDPNASYGPIIGLLYVFNLIVGTGALALPKAFQTAGVILAPLLLALSGVFSYISATFVLEALSIANAVKKKRRRDSGRETDDDGDSESGVDVDDFEISRRIEVSEMASMFLGRAGVIVSYLVMCVYLFGDLAIYSTTVPKSLMNVLCASAHGENASVPSPDSPCLGSSSSVPWLDRQTVYRLCVLVFVACVSPMVVVGVTRTRHLQMATTFSRWAAFLLMLVLASVQLVGNGAAGHPPLAEPHGFGALFGVTVYAFMCHHSLPGIITPMESKRGLMYRLMIVYAVVMSFYASLSFTASYAFEHVLDIYTLNFLHDGNRSPIYWLIDHFLALFPVFTLTTNYPIVAITLINNVSALRDLISTRASGSNSSALATEQESLLLGADGASPDADGSSPIHNVQRRRDSTGPDIWTKIIPIALIAAPTVISLCSDNVLLLASITGSYPGVGVQFLVPCMLVVKARRKLSESGGVPQHHASPFRSIWWPVVICIWSLFAIAMVTLNMLHVTF